MKLSAHTSRFTNAKSTITAPGLFAWNKWLALLHAAQGVAILLLASAGGPPVTINYITQDTLVSKATAHTVLTTASRQLFDLNLAYVVAAFFFISALTHLALVTVCRKRYEANVQQGINPVRWIGYGFSTSTMLMAVAVLVGVHDIALLIALFVLNLVLYLAGWVMELVNKARGKTQTLLPFVVGGISGAVPWIVFLVYLVGANTYGSGDVPAYVYWICASIFLVFVAFAASMWLQFKKKGAWANYLHSEQVFMVLNLIGATALAWQVYAGALRP